MPQVSFKSEKGKRRILEIQRLLRREVMCINQLAVEMELTTQIIQPYVTHLRENDYLEIVRKEKAAYGAFKYFYRWGNKELDFDVEELPKPKPRKEKAMRDPLVSAFFGS